MFASYRVRELPSACGTMVKKTMHWSFAAQGDHFRNLQFIGEESGYELLDNCTIVTSPYEVDGRILGVLGVIGPTRMAYERVIPIVDVTARMLSLALSKEKKG